MSHGGSRRRRGWRLRRMVTAAATLGELFGSSTREDSSSGGVTVDAGIIVAVAIMGEIIAAGISTIPAREVVPRRVTSTSRIDNRSEITTSSSSSNNSRITVVDGRETPEEEEDSGTVAGEGRMNSSRSRDRQ